MTSTILTQGANAKCGPRFWLALAAAFWIVGMALASRLVAAPDEDQPPGALWFVVHDLCVVDQSVTGLPWPCLVANLRQGFAVLRDPKHATHILVVPTRRIVGIESPELLTPDAPNYWRDAWSARAAFERLVGHKVPRADIALAVNSKPGRTQDQLHIHLDCVRPQVKATLELHLGEIGRRWRILSVPLQTRRVWVRRIDSRDFSGADPFKLLAAGVAHTPQDRSLETLSAVGTDFGDGQPGFVLIRRRADPAAGDLASGEDILDYGCRILQPG